MVGDDADAPLGTECLPNKLLRGGGSAAADAAVDAVGLRIAGVGTAEPLTFNDERERAAEDIERGAVTAVDVDAPTGVVHSTVEGV